MKYYVKVYRAMHNLTQAQLVGKLEVSRATINAIEKPCTKYDKRETKRAIDFFFVTDVTNGTERSNQAA
ncbi:MAG: hypothetical protein PHF03_06325 [Syntrophomonadaceae bacterium]|nr:hypothetical protein [Syntrophomonadaceae bacterium]MDD3899485.1 hypothetical protein [Syntrophomonadaceae bacterium]